MEITFKQTSSCVLYCGTATRPCSQHKKAAELVWKCLHRTESWVAGYWQSCKSKGVPICSFIFLPHMSFPKSLKPNLVLLPSIYFFFLNLAHLYLPLFVHSSLLPHILTSAPAVLSVMLLAVVCLLSFLPATPAVKCLAVAVKLNCSTSKAWAQGIKSLASGESAYKFKTSQVLNICSIWTPCVVSLLYHTVNMSSHGMHVQGASMSTCTYTSLVIICFF